MFSLQDLASSEKAFLQSTAECAREGRHPALQSTSGERLVADEGCGGHGGHAESLRDQDEALGHGYDDFAINI